MRGDMTWTETFNCDICGKQKGTVDHWWLAWSEPFVPHAEAPERHMLKVYPWENMLAHDANARHLCGQACLQKLVDRWMTKYPRTGTLEDEFKKLQNSMRGLFERLFS